MNKAQKLLKEVMVLLGMEVKLSQMMLADGTTKVEAEAFEVGFSVGMVTEDGIVALPIGEYTLEDGTVLTVEVEGIIATVTPKSEDAPSDEPVVPVAASEPVDAQAKKIVESIVKESFFSKHEEDAKTITELKAEIESLKVQLSNEPAATPIVVSPEPVVQRELTPLEKFKAIREELKANPLN